jgi:CarD family transcriptional regulator
MPDFAVGDKVMYPHRGAGKIVGVENLELVEGYVDYYVIEIPRDRLTLRVPFGKATDLGLRPVMTKTKMNKILRILRSEPRELPLDYKERQQQIEIMLRTCSSSEIAEAVRDLTWHEERAHLTKRDNDLLSQGRDLLASEMAMATDVDALEVQQTIDATLAKATAARLKAAQTQ